MVQYLHLISNTTASNPLDVWTPSTPNIKPELGDQFTLGYFRTVTGSTAQYEFSAETYLRFYAKPNRLYRRSRFVHSINILKDDLLSGKGRAYGIELYAQKKTVRTQRLISYTLRENVNLTE